VPDLTVDQLTVAVGLAGGVALLSLLLALLLWARLRAARRRFTLLRTEGDDQDILSGISGVVRRVEALEGRVDSTLEALQEEVAAGRFALQRFHLVRYDAFDDMGGRLSFSAALLDDHGDGLVLTSINGRSETRTYAKDVVNLASRHSLSDEEREAIAGAFAGHGRVRTAAVR
jgi:hypothetical protein